VPGIAQKGVTALGKVGKAILGVAKAHPVAAAVIAAAAAVAGAAYAAWYHSSTEVAKRIAKQD
jgi:hypothetical protein